MNSTRTDEHKFLELVDENRNKILRVCRVYAWNSADQDDLLGSVLWWYLLPPTIGLLISTWGMRINLHTKIPATLLFIALDAFVYWLNQWARSKQLFPLEAQLQSLSWFSRRNNHRCPYVLTTHRSAASSPKSFQRSL